MSILEKAAQYPDRQRLSCFWENYFFTMNTKSKGIWHLIVQTGFGQKHNTQRFGTKKAEKTPSDYNFVLTVCFTTIHWMAPLPLSGFAFSWVPYYHGANSTASGNFALNKWKSNFIRGPQVCKCKASSQNYELQLPAQQSGLQSASVKGSGTATCNNYNNQKNPNPQSILAKNGN